MLRIRYTPQDLLKIRFAAEPAPLVELVVALMTLRKRDRDIFDLWRQQAWRAFPRDAQVLLDLVFPDPGPEYLDCLDPRFEQAVDIVLTAAPPGLLPLSLDDLAPPHPERDNRQRLRHALHAAHDSLLSKIWPRVVTIFHTDLAFRSHVVATQGIKSAIATVFPDARWSGDTLELASRRHHDVRLNGQGITLMPTAFWTGRPLISRVTGRPMLVTYPATTPLPLVADPREEPAKALTALLGQTRAAVLDTITRTPATTGELARRLNISPGRASEHATILRNAGLITSHRHRNTVLHTPTPLSRHLADPPAG